MHAATERMYSDVASPMALYATINPQYTLEKARELYGGAPRPLSGAANCRCQYTWRVIVWHRPGCVVPIVRALIYHIWYC